ncbi:hypothetical protein [Nakamurella antarctica]|nr:hypothetical protein [Nakamurella antarctica]
MTRQQCPILEDAMIKDASLVSHAIVVWTGWDAASWPSRDDA